MNCLAVCSDCCVDDCAVLCDQLELPQCELVLNRCDEAAEFDDPIDAQQNFDDDPSIVVFRKGNKIGFFVVVTPECEDDIKVLVYYELLFTQQNASLLVHIAGWICSDCMVK